MHARVIARALFAAALLAGCQSVTGQVCTLIGCESGLSVELTGSLGVPFRVEVTTEGSPLRMVRECPTAADCQRIFFADYTPSSPVIRVITGSDTTTVRRTVEYARHEPNGPGCGPICRVGVVPVDLAGTR